MDTPTAARNLSQEKNADYQVYEVGGSPVEIGRGMAGHRPRLGGPPLGELTVQQVDFALACAEVVAREHPPLLAEVRAMAEVYARPVEEAYFFLSVGLTEVPVRSGVRYRRPRVEPGRGEASGAERDLPGSAPPHCSSLAVLTPQGPVAGRNYDFFYWSDVRHLVTARPSRHLAHVGMYDGVLGARYDGLNEAGLFASLHGVRSPSPERRRPGLFCGHVLRVVLDTCRTAREAADRIAALPHLSSYSYLLADPEEALVVEAHPDRVRVRRPEAGVLAATNHFSHPDMVPLARRAARGSLARQAHLTGGGRGLTALTPDQAREAVEALMRDHSTPVCGHTDGLATFWSAVAIPGRKEVAYCLGAPCRNPYSRRVAFE